MVSDDPQGARDSHCLGVHVLPAVGCLDEVPRWFNIWFTAAYRCAVLADYLEVAASAISFKSHRAALASCRAYTWYDGRPAIPHLSAIPAPRQCQRPSAATP